MIEHRLIEKMLAVAGKAAASFQAAERIDPVFIDSVVDFIRMYADRTHHGKEEDILFKKLAAKKMEAEDTRMMQELIQEHVTARVKVGELVEAKERFLKNETRAIQDVIDRLSWLIDFYPLHIEKEDKVFFPRAERYFTGREREKMLAEFNEFDRRMIHEKYRRLVERLQAGAAE